MPNWDFGYDYGQGNYLRLKAWREHYIAKGCNQFKAWSLADKKRHKGTWPSA